MAVNVYVRVNALGTCDRLPRPWIFSPPSWPATAAIANFAGLLFASSFLRRRADREYGVAALICAGAGLHAGAMLVAVRARDPGVVMVAQRVATLGIVAALLFAIHFALVYRGRPAPRRALGLWYAAGALVAAIDLRWPAPMRASSVLPSNGVGVATQLALLGGSGIMTFAATLVATSVVLFLVARAYLAGQRGALAVVLGATVLLAAVLNDVGVATGALSTIYLTDAGLAAFVIGIATTPSARYAVLTEELEERTNELRKRTRELRRSYEDLHATQEELVKKEQLAVVGELAAVIAHEVRNPLAIIANAGAGLRKQAISWEDQETLLTILEEETSRLNRLVTDLLRYMRVQSTCSART